jgi:pyruvate/2-oxoglutarate dehydrogenase complex dihydrolipoamide acyltransferase (E2) component
MNKRIGPYHVVDLPPGRRDVLNFLNLSSWAHYIFALLEVDVTVARQLMDEYNARTGEKLSFTGYLTFCLARAIDQDRSVQAYLNSRGQLVVFDDVDVGMMIERQMGETRAPIGYVIRRANHKTFMEIHREIRAVQAGRALQREFKSSRLALLRRLPGPLRNLSGAFVRRAIRRDPAGMWVPMAGTVAVTAVGMFGNGSGWGLAAPGGHSLCLIVGGIARKPAVVQDRVEPRELLSLTVAFDHDIVDGAPAARFSQCLKELIECGYGLDEDRTSSSLDAEAAGIGNT